MIGKTGLASMGKKQSARYESGGRPSVFSRARRPSAALARGNSVPDGRLGCRLADDILFLLAGQRSNDQTPTAARQHRQPKRRYP